MQQTPSSDTCVCLRMKYMENAIRESKDKEYPQKGERNKTRSLKENSNPEGKTNIQSIPSFY